MELNDRHVTWLLEHLGRAEYGDRAEVDLSEEAQDLVVLGYADMRPCFVRNFVFLVCTGPKGKELLKTRFRVKYTHFLMKRGEATAACTQIHHMSMEELPEFLTHKKAYARSIAWKRMKELGR
jgi:hypothetical protein